MCQLTCVLQVAWNTGELLKQWQTSVLVPIHKKGDNKKCTNYCGVSLLGFHGKSYTNCFEKRWCEIVKPQLQDAQCGFHPGRYTID